MVSENKPFFSVVIPLYNKQDYVKETIKTVLNQTFQDFEIVVINDGSIDESAEIVELIQDNRIRLIHQKNSGVSVARNRGIEESKAEYITFLDADDLWLADFLETIFKLIKNYPNAGLYATAYEMQTEDKIRKLKIGALPSKIFEGIIPNYFKSLLCGDYLVCTSALCIPKKVFYKHNIWFPIGEKRGEDQYVWARIALALDIVYSTKICAIYKLYTVNSTTASKCDFLEPRKFLLNLKEYKNVKNDEELNVYLDKYLEREILNFFKTNISNGKKNYSIIQLLNYKISFLSKVKILFYFFTPLFLYKFIKNTKNSLLFNLTFAPKTK